MNRSLTLWIGPETVLATLGAAVFWFCARHASGEGRDVALMEKLLMLLPWVVVPLAFATVCVPGGKSGWWLTRAIGFTYLMLIVCGCRIIAGFGSGARGQDAAFIIVLVFGTAAIALATSITGAMILAETKPAFAAWFGAHKFLGSLAALAAAIPIGFALGTAATVGTGAIAAFYSAFKS